jgi:ETFB lysine methyltransferase
MGSPAPGAKVPTRKNFPPNASVVLFASKHRPKRLGKFAAAPPLRGFSPAQAQTTYHGGPPKAGTFSYLVGKTMASVRFRYQTLEFGAWDIHLKSLRDHQEYADPEGLARALGILDANWALYGVLWQSGEVLARIMLDFAIGNKRILEVGCGLGLSSLLLNQRNADITATDYHPEVAALLASNTQLNGGKPIPFLRADWSDLETALGKFDVIIGSDLLYERDHAQLLSQFIHRHSGTACEVLMIDPGRGHQGRFCQHMRALGFSGGRSSPSAWLQPNSAFRGHLLHFARP